MSRSGSMRVRVRVRVQVGWPSLALACSAPSGAMTSAPRACVTRDLDGGVAQPGRVAARVARRMERVVVGGESPPAGPGWPLEQRSPQSG